MSNKIDPEQDTGWQGATLETPQTPLVDSAKGRPLILRPFRFMKKPDVWAKMTPSNQELFNFHWPQMKAMIWADGLVANTDVLPRVVLQKTAYTIFILCEPRWQHGRPGMFIDKPRTLQEVLKDSLTKKPK